MRLGMSKILTRTPTLTLNPCPPTCPFALHRFSACENNITATLGNVLQSKSLTSFKISSNSFAGKIPGNLHQKCPSLTELNLFGNNIAGTW